jgi:hypothetical protein
MVRLLVMVVLVDLVEVVLAGLMSRLELNQTA